jgi:hypothetical protein
VSFAPQAICTTWVTFDGVVSWPAPLLPQPVSRVVACPHAEAVAAIEMKQEEACSSFRVMCMPVISAAGSAFEVKSPETSEAEM